MASIQTLPAFPHGQGEPLCLFPRLQMKVYFMFSLSAPLSRVVVTGAGVASFETLSGSKVHFLWTTELVLADGRPQAAHSQAQ